MTEHNNDLPDWLIYIAVALIVGIFAAWVFFVNGQL
jgi:hypothetical protein